MENLVSKTLKELGLLCQSDDKRIALTILVEKTENKIAEWDNLAFILPNGFLVSSAKLKNLSYKSVFLQNYYILLTTDGKVFATRNLRKDEDEEDDDKEDLIPKLPKIKKIWYKEGTCFAITKEGELISWGNNYNNKLTIPKVKNVKSVCLSTFHTFFLLKTGEIINFGKPGPFDDFLNEIYRFNGKISQIEMSMKHVLLLLFDGRLIGLGEWFKLDQTLIPDWLHGKIIKICAINWRGFSLLLEDGTIYLRIFGLTGKSLFDPPQEYQGKFVNHIWGLKNCYGVLWNGSVISWPESLKLPNLF